VFVPVTCPPIKLRRLADYGADVTVIGEVFEESLASAEQFAAGSGALLVHPFDQPLTVAGVGTVTAEFSEQVPDLDTILIAVGGGGLLAGALAALQGTATRAVAVEPSSAGCLGAALEAGKPVDVAVSGPAVDSLGVRRVGQLAFAAAIAHQVQHIDVTDEAITAAQVSAWEGLRIGLEAGGATSLAALRDDWGNHARGRCLPSDFQPGEGDHVAAFPAKHTAPTRVEPSCIRLPINRREADQSVGAA
jgi:threonine dehydratase